MIHEYEEEEMKHLQEELGELICNNPAVKMFDNFIKGRHRMALNDLENGDKPNILFKAQGARKEDKEIINFLKTCKDLYLNKTQKDS